MPGRLPAMGEESLAVPFLFLIFLAKHVKFWTLSTVSSGKFNPSRLTERQQIAFVAAKSSAVNVDDFEASPYRLDRLAVQAIPSSTHSRPKQSSKLSSLSQINVVEEEEESETSLDLKPADNPESVDCTLLAQEGKHEVLNAIESGDDFDHLTPTLALFHRRYLNLARIRELSKSD